MTSSGWLFLKQSNAMGMSLGPDLSNVNQYAPDPKCVNGALSLGISSPQEALASTSFTGTDFCAESFLASSCGTVGDGRMCKIDELNLPAYPPLLKSYG
jgi:hypothetical protein